MVVTTWLNRFAQREEPDQFEGVGKHLIWPKIGYSAEILSCEDNLR